MSRRSRRSRLPSVSASASRRSPRDRAGRRRTASSWPPRWSMPWGLTVGTSRAFPAWSAGSATRPRGPARAGGQGGMQRLICSPGAGPVYAGAGRRSRWHAPDREGCCHAVGLRAGLGAPPAPRGLARSTPRRSRSSIEAAPRRRSPPRGRLAWLVAFGQDRGPRARGARRLRRHATRLWREKAGEAFDPAAYEFVVEQDWRRQRPPIRRPVGHHRSRSASGPTAARSRKRLAAAGRGLVGGVRPDRGGGTRGAAQGSPWRRPGTATR